MKKRLALPTTLVLGILMIGLLSVSYASAQEISEYSPIIQKLAQRFNLNEADVQAVFDEDRDDRQAQMQAIFSERLDDMVNGGKITSDQKQAILDKHEEMHNKMLEMKDLEPEERHERMLIIHEEMKSWAENEGIEMPFMMFQFGGPGEYRRGFRMDHFSEKLN